MSIKKPCILFKYMVLMVGVQGFEPRVVESESTALPLGDTPVYLIFKWTIRDSNPGPTGYEPVALTN